MKKILLVEADRLLVKIYQNELEKQGFKVQITERSHTIQDKILTFKPDLILLDLVLPTAADGFKALSRIRQAPETTNQLVVVLSGLESEAAVNKAKKLGVDHYFYKSDVNFGQVIDHIKNYLRE